ncbi:MAG: hypothetical protein AAF555_05280 [Verrucomicrobiota bacterium]
MKLSLLLSLTALLLGGCASQQALIDRRIERNPLGFQALSPKEQSLARSGNIAVGMPKAGVEIAWGRPSRRSEGQSGSSRVERWVYTRDEPVFTGLSGGFHGGFGRRFGYYGVSVGPEIIYLPTQVAEVEFKNSRVDSWNAVRR